MKRLWRIGLAVLVIGLVSAASVSAQVPPTGSPQVNTSATVGGGGGGPTVQAFWALPDMSPNDAAMTYCPPSGADIHSDTTNIPTVPFKPNLLDSPLARQVEFFAVVSGAAGPSDIGTVYVDVYHPGGGLKYELALTLLDSNSGAAQNYLGSPTTQCKPLEAAIHTGQVPAANGDTIFNNVGIGKSWRVYHVIGDVSKDQPYGIYPYFILATAADGSATTQTGNQTFEVLQNAGFAVDFPATIPPAPPGLVLDWGVIKPGNMALVQGDYIWANGIPSVMATGNVYLNLNAQWSTMVGLRWLKVIDRYFDITVGTQSRPRLTTAQGTKEILALQAPYFKDRIRAATAVKLDNYVLESDIPTEIDLSLTALQAGFLDGTAESTGLPADTYVGTMWLWGNAAPAANQNPYMTQNLVWPPQ